jgi:hypothetical protein
VLVGRLDITQPAIKGIADVYRRPSVGLIQKLDRLRACSAGVNHRKPRAGALFGRRTVAARTPSTSSIAARYIFEQAETSPVNPTTVGTGSTPFMPYLKSHRDETWAHLHR